MKRATAVVLSVALSLALSHTVVAEAKENQPVPDALNFTMKTLAGEEVSLDKYQGKVVLLVNVASECGLTPQYKQLQQLHEKYGDQGLAVVGVPCNQFGAQEPGSAEEIRNFCTKEYGVTFDLLGKVDVNGDQACELYQYLTKLETKPTGAGEITWNFEKFLIGRDGKVLARFAPRIQPDSPEIVSAIEEELKQQ